MSKRSMIIIAVLALFVLGSGLGTFMYFKAKGESTDTPAMADNTAQPKGEDNPEKETPPQITLPPGVEEPYCDCLADKLRPSDEWLPTRYSKSLWATRDLPTEEEINAYWERLKKDRMIKNHPENSREQLMADLDSPNSDLHYSVTRFFREKVDINEPAGISATYLDPKTYYDRIRFEYLGPDYYKGPIPGSRVEETFMERYAIHVAAHKNGLSPELLAKTGGRPLTEEPDAFDAETGLLWDQLNPYAQEASTFNFSNAYFENVILLDYKLNDKGHLTEFTFRPLGRREAFRAIIENPIESFIMDRFWGGWDSLDKNGIAMVRADKENETYLQDLIRYRQPIGIHLNQDLKRKSQVGKLVTWRTHDEYIKLWDPADNKVVVEVTDVRRENPKNFVKVYYGGDFVFELSEYVFTPIKIAQNEMYPEVAEQMIKEDPEVMKEKFENHVNNIWTYRDDHGTPTEHVYTYSLRDKLTGLAPPFTGIKEYDGPIKFPYENDPNWKNDPELFSFYMGFSISGL